MKEEYSNANGLHARLAVSVKEAAEIAGISRSELYQRLAGGKELQGKKLGRRTIILVESLRTYLGSLPPYTGKGGAA